MTTEPKGHSEASVDELVAWLGRRSAQDKRFNATERRNYAKAADALEAHALQIANLKADAQFLCDRVRELEGETTDDDELSRQYFGHVVPALARMEDALNSVSGVKL